MKFLNYLHLLWFIFALLDPDPDPATQINADPCGSGSETLESPHIVLSVFVSREGSGVYYGLDLSLTN